MNMSEEKKENLTTEEKDTEKTVESSSEKMESEESGSEDMKSVENQTTLSEQTNQNDTDQQTKVSAKSEEANGAVPPVQSVSTGKEKKSGKHIWKAVLKYVLVFLVAGCGAFAGSYTAIRFSRQQEEKDMQNAFRSFGSQLPFGNGSTENQSSGPALGITIQQTENGIEIVGFASDSNAESAGLKTGDIITKVDGKTYDSVNDIADYISSKKVGDKVKVTVKRNNEEKTYTVKLVKKNLSAYSVPDDGDSDSSTPKALPGTDGENSGLQG